MRQERQNQRRLPGFTFGGPIWKDRIFGFIGFNPEFNDLERGVNYDQTGGLGGGLGLVNFSQNTQTYYTSARLDFEVTKKLRVYASWLYQLQKLAGEGLPAPDSSTGLFNVSSTVDPSAYSHGVAIRLRTPQSMWARITALPRVSF